MTGASSGSERGLRSFRLSEVPESVRLRALDKLLRTDGSPNGLLVASLSLPERIALGVAATRPSDRVYWVTAGAYDRVFARKGRR